MIYYKTGNLLTDTSDVLVNTVNTVGVMGKGIALAFKHEFPYNYIRYRELCFEGNFNTGQLLAISDEGENAGCKVIINFPTKKHWRNNSEYEYIESGLRKLRQYIIDKGVKSIAIPALGCKNGGLEWGRVNTMIVHYLQGLDCEINLYPPQS